MRFASLGSGSEGNALLVEAGDSRVMLDCGFGLRETERRLNRLGCKPNDLHAIVITHEHADHIGSAYSLALSYSLPLYMSYGTYQATKRKRIFVGAHQIFAFAKLITPYILVN